MLVILAYLDVMTSSFWGLMLMLSQESGRWVSKFSIQDRICNSIAAAAAAYKLGSECSIAKNDISCMKLFTLHVLKPNIAIRKHNINAITNSLVLAFWVTG